MTNNNYHRSIPLHFALRHQSNLADFWTNESGYFGACVKGLLRLEEGHQNVKVIPVAAVCV